jgi:hypothetical protein
MAVQLRGNNCTTACSDLQTSSEHPQLFDRKYSCIFRLLLLMLMLMLLLLLLLLLMLLLMLLLLPLELSRRLVCQRRSEVGVHLHV